MKKQLEFTDAEEEVVIGAIIPIAYAGYKKHPKSNDNSELMK